MFVDASAIVAVLLREPGFEAILNVLDNPKEPLRVSPLVRYEAVLAVAKARSRRAPGRLSAESIRLAADAVDLCLRATGATEVDVTAEIGRSAVEASARFGKVVGHRADLNFGDCFAYACTVANGDALLFVGDDFVHTDLRLALASR